MNAKLGWDTAVAAAERNQPTEDQAAVVRRLTAEIDQLKTLSSEVRRQLMEICDGSNWPDIAQKGDGFQAYTECTNRINQIVMDLFEVGK
jgi:hypothetical protein